MPSPQEREIQIPRAKGAVEEFKRELIELQRRLDAIPHTSLSLEEVLAKLKDSLAAGRT